MAYQSIRYIHCNQRETREKHRSEDRPLQTERSSGAAKDGHAKELGAGVELEGGPVEGAVIGAGGVDESEFGIAQSCGGILACGNAFVEFVHQLRCRGAADFPESSDDVVRTSAEEGPGKADEAFAGELAFTGAVTRRNGNQIGIERALNDVPRVELVAIAFRRKNDRGFQRARDAGGAVRGEVDIRVLPGIAGKIVGSDGFRAGGYATALLGKVFFKSGEFFTCIGERRKIFAGGQGVAEKEKIGGFGRRFAMGAGEKGERVGDGDGDVFDPVVRLRIGNEKRFKIKAIEAAVREDDDAGVFGDEFFGGPDEDFVEFFAVGVAGFERVAGIEERLAIGFCGGVYFRTGGERKQRNFGRRDDPEVGAVLA